MSGHLPPARSGVEAVRAAHGPLSSDAYVGREMMPGFRGGDRIAYSGGLHQLVFGPSGVGKGMRLLAPNLLSMFGKSIVVIDPKGQLAAMTGLYRQMMGDDVHVIDPFGVLASFVAERADMRPLLTSGLSESAGFNPLITLDPSSISFFEDAIALSQALVRIDGNVSDPHWPESARGLVAALIMWECERCDPNSRVPAALRGEVPSLAHVRMMLTEADAFDVIDMVDPETGRPESVEIQTKGLRATAQLMVKHGSFAVQSLAGRFANTATDEIESIKSAANTHTQWMLSRAMRENAEAARIVDFSRLKTGAQPTTVYIVLPPGYLEANSIWLRLIVTVVIQSCLSMQRGREVLLLMDEFPALGHLELIQSQWGVARDYALQFWATLQNLEQLQRLYPASWHTILASTGVKQFFRTDDLTTTKWISDRSPPTTFTALGWNDSKNPDGRPSSTLTKSQHGRQSILPHFMFGLPDECTVAFFSQNEEPAVLYMPHLMTQMTTLSKRSLPNPYYSK